MALINCPECSKEISDSVKKCPHCGYKIKKEKVQKEKKSISKKPVIILIVVLIVIGVFCGIGYLATANSRAYKEAQLLFNDRKFEEANSKFVELGDYKDSADQAKECTYQIAKKAYEEEKYEDAKKSFGEIADYKDSKKMIDDCEYQLSVDVQFLRDLGKGLVARWDALSDDEDSMSDAEFKEYRTKVVNCELDSVGKYIEMDFSDKELGEKAVKYIEALNKQIEAMPYYGNNVTKYSNMWDEAYNTRATLLSDFVIKYGLTVDDEHAKELDNFKDVASSLEEEERIKEEVKKMLKSEFEKVSDSYGWKEYELQITNTAGVTFSYFSVEIKLYDENDVEIESTYTNSLDDFKDGDKAVLSFSTDCDFSRYEWSAEWYYE